MMDMQNPVPANVGHPSPDFSAYESATCTGDPVGGGACARWVGKPGNFLESQDDFPTGATYRAARLQCSPYFTDWVAELKGATIAVFGADITPSSTYSVQTYGASCNVTPFNPGCAEVGTAVTMTTRRHGDVATPYQIPTDALTQPASLDLIAMVKRVSGAPGSSSAGVMRRP